MEPANLRRIRVFCDSDVLIAGSASTTGASHILLRLSELTLLDCVTSRYAITEAERNLLTKLSAALPVFRLILKAAITIVSDPPSSLRQQLMDQADEKDMPILAAAIACEADFLATFNFRHFQPRKTAPLIFRPGKILSQIRQSLNSLLN